MKHRKPYKTYTREFKQEAVRLLQTADRPAAEIAMELGIRRIQLYKWKEQLAKKGENRNALLRHHHGIGRLHHKHVISAIEVNCPFQSRMDAERRWQGRPGIRNLHRAPIADTSGGITATGRNGLCCTN